MKISEVKITGFKRFTDLIIKDIPQSAKIVIIIGPNGSGKSSLFDAFHRWYRNKIDSYSGRDDIYYSKFQNIKFDYDKAINITFHDFNPPPAYEDRSKFEGKFYFRSAYRNQADFTVSSLRQLDDPAKKISIDNLIQNDATVGDNYQRLVSLTLKSIYDEENDNKLVKNVREDLIGKLKQSLLNVFHDLTLCSIGDPLKNGTFYFEKGSSKNYHYKNLSGGEKAAFDIILDLIIKSSYFNDSIYCIDEPEIHMHTQLQATLFNEIYSLVPSDPQLWINTHSLGILRKAKEIEAANPNTIAFINFDGVDFDGSVSISPIKIDKSIWQKFIQLTLDDYSEFIAPEKIVLCEGSLIGTKNKNFDSEIYNKVFSDEFPDVLFVSIGSSNDLENDNNPSYKILKAVLKKSKIIRLVDCDDKSEQEIHDLVEHGIKVLSQRHIESYLWDDEVLEKLCILHNQSEKSQEIIAIKKQLIDSSNTRGNPIDDVKSASAQLYVETKKILNLTKCGNDKNSFARDTLAPLITSETKIYKVLKDDIFKK